MFGSTFLIFARLAIFHWLFDHFFEKDEEIKKTPVIWMLIYLAICGIAYLYNISFVSPILDIIAECFIILSSVYLLLNIPFLLGKRFMTSGIGGLVLLFYALILRFILIIYVVLASLLVDYNSMKISKLDNNYIFKERYIDGKFLKNRLTIFISKRVDKFIFLERLSIQRDYKSQTKCYNKLKIKNIQKVIYIESFPEKGARYDEKFTDTIRIN